jgi:hypothetical protein
MIAVIKLVCRTQLAFARTLRRDAEKCERQDDQRAVRLRKLPLVLLRLPPCCASASDGPTLLTELAHVRSD